MTSFTKRWGLSARRKLKKSSPFASLCLEISSSLTESEFSSLRLAIGVDKLIMRKKLSTAKNAPDLIGQLHEEDIISSTDTHFLEQLLKKIGRKDLVKLILQYHEKGNQIENTPPSDENTDVKTATDQSFTQLKQPVSDFTSTTVMKNVHPRHNLPVAQKLPVSRRTDQGLGDVPLKRGRFSFPPLPHQAAASRRLSTDGSSTCTNTPSGDQTNDTSPVTQKSSPDGSLQDDALSQMSIDSSQKSVMSISDDEKIYVLNDMVWLNDTDDAIMESL